MNILGISAYYHDSSACLVNSGKVVAAAQEERFSRIKHDARFPEASIDYCLQSGGIESGDLDLVVFYEKPFRKFERLLSTYLTYAPRGIHQALHSIPVWIKEKIWIKEAIHRYLPDCEKILFTEHHMGHAASAFFPSPFDKAAYLTIDGVGEFATASYGKGVENRVTPLAELHFPHSLGLLYSAFTAYCGFRINSDEYKLMGLAPYGTPRFSQLILDTLIDLKGDGSFRLNMDYFGFCTGLSSTNDKFHKLFGAAPRTKGKPLTQLHMDIARSIQDVTEEIYLRLAHHVHRETGESRLCLSGGVALNCVANGRLLREGPFRDIWIQPAAGDAGSALGAALWGWHHYLGQPRPAQASGDRMQGAQLGPSFSEQEMACSLDRSNACYEKLSEESLLDRTSSSLANGKVVGWFQGRMEYGPRALGNRSILADARSPVMQSVVNQKIKFREDFRPFAPVILEDKLPDYFDLSTPSPYMLIVDQVKRNRLKQMSPDEESKTGLEKIGVVRSEIPAVTHVDNSARIQTVNASDNPLLYRLLRTFEKQTGCPLLLNTSFNVSEEPIVCSPDDAYRCFMATDMDVLVVGPYLLDKQHQPARELDENQREGAGEPAHNYKSLTHKTNERRQHKVFGLLFGTLALIAGVTLHFYQHSMVLPWIIAGFTLLGLGVLAPSLLGPAYRVWMAFGKQAGWLMSKIILVFFYYFALWPTALLARLTGKKFLETGPDPTRSSYWEPSVATDNERISGQKQY